MTMDVWRHKTLALAAVLLISVGSTGVAIAQDEDTKAGPRAVAGPHQAGPSAGDVRAVTDLLFLAYPDLTERPTSFTINRQDGKLVAVVEDAVTSPAASREPAPEPLLDAVVAFDADGSLRSFVANGVWLDRTRNDAFKAALREHPDWADSDAEVKLAALGGRAAPPATAAAIGEISSSGWQRYLGKNVRAGTAGLRLRQRRPESGATPAFDTIPGWVREVDATRANGKAAVYELRFEPFGGRLVAVSRQ
jgi:hypothetical protein